MYHEGLSSLVEILPPVFLFIGSAFVGGKDREFSRKMKNNLNKIIFFEQMTGKLRANWVVGNETGTKGELVPGGCTGRATRAAGSG